MANNKSKVTLKDIAKKTGYSVNTVSRALREKDDIGKQTKEKIKKVAKEMGHVNNNLAASLRLGYTKTIAIILGDISNPHFAINMKDIETHASKFGYTSILYNTNENDEEELKAIKSALTKNVDGIIICPTQKNQKNLEYLDSTDIPFVLIGRRDTNYNYAVCNDELGGYQATKTLIDAGHKDILMLHGPIYISSAKERLNGYLKALEEANYKVNKKLIREVPITANGCEDVLNQLDKEKINYTAIFAFSDLLAWEAWDYLQECGLDVPKDCSIVGFDNIQSRIRLPFKLTSISSYKGKMSSTAVDILINQMKDKDENKQIIIDTSVAKGNTIRNI